MCEVKDKVFLVTGAVGGIGSALVRAALQDGAKHVIALDIDENQGKELESELKGVYGQNKIKFIKCDVTSDLENAYDLVMKEFGYIDVVINNAGIMNDSPNAYLKEIAVNVTALITSSLKAFDLMRKDRGGKGGTIINISSIVALAQTSILPIYSATKSAVLQFSNCLGIEQTFSWSGVRVLAVCFGSTDTPLISLQKLGGFTKEYDEKIHAGIQTMPQQSAYSAAQGLLTAYRNGISGSTWLVTSNRPAEEITENVKKAYETLSEGIYQ
ncbi:unnamed protein product [Parnassius apollo]|uniref:(apollo) hypothetical protein n=1 Tax=Parnassius apollo TaxID=110799 RepID=A0A8S3XCJ2_PARAO|nr:unnamed protein product [Parnassius apollo]